MIQLLPYLPLGLCGEIVEVICVPWPVRINIAMPTNVNTIGVLRRNPMSVCSKQLFLCCMVDDGHTYRPQNAKIMRSGNLFAETPAEGAATV
ncbi:hypothetical protein BW107_21605 [Salmonella enterica]|nr:hypothetical protein [Salmonella enterica]